MTRVPIDTRKPLVTATYGKRKNAPPRYPSGLFFTTAAGCVYVDDLTEISDMAQRAPVQLCLFEEAV